jgi:tetratricopeptide (TPR) repeat protein
VVVVLLALLAGGYFVLGRRSAKAAHKEREVSAPQPAVPPADSTKSDMPPPPGEPGASRPESKPQEQEVTPAARQARAFVTRGNQALDNGNYQAAIASFREALRIDPGNTAAEAGLQRAQRARRAEAEVLGRRR